MSLRHFVQPYRFKFTLRPLNNKLNGVTEKFKNIQFPERFKGTILERWATYWKNLYADYKDVAIDVVKDCKERPVRAGVYTSILASCYYLCKHNPDECAFREQLLESSGKVMQVGELIRNPFSEQHVTWLERCYNEGTIRRLNLGIASVIWIDNYDELCSLYKAVCPYLKPRYLTFYERIVDVGFLDTWWVLEGKMKDYDVNEVEFADVQS